MAERAAIASFLSQLVSAWLFGRWVKDALWINCANKSEEASEQTLLGQIDQRAAEGQEGVERAGGDHASPLQEVLFSQEEMTVGDTARVHLSAKCPPHGPEGTRRPSSHPA